MSKERHTGHKSRFLSSYLILVKTRLTKDVLHKNQHSKSFCIPDSFYPSYEQDVYAVKAKWEVIQICVAWC